MSIPVVSVITLTYNQDRLLPECVDSVLGQSFSSLEQVVVDDESTDTTPAVLARYSDPRLRVIRQPHQGLERLPQTYENAYAACRGSLIGFADGDDYWSRDQLELLVPAFDDPDVVVAFGQTQLVGNLAPGVAPTIPTPDFHRRFPRGALFNTPIGAATRAMLDPETLTFPFPISVLIRRSALDRIGGLVTYPGLPVMDYPTLLRLTLEGKFHYVDRTLGFWRVHGGSTTSRWPSRIQLGVVNFIDDFRQKYAGRLDLTDQEWNDLDRKWDERCVWNGKVALQNKFWQEARAHFLRVARSGAGREMRAVAFAGVLSSLMHRSLSNGLQWFFARRVSRLLGRA